MKNLQLPFGIQDYMPEEYYNRSLVENNLASVFAEHGFLRVATPAIEYFDVYDEILSRDALNKTFKMTDTDGSLLMLRSDPTLQICRMAATKLCADKLNKVCYFENSYEYLTDPSTARSREFPQAGVELLGTSGDEADIEIITVAIESLIKAGLSDFMLEIGQVEYFEGLTEEAGLSNAQADELRHLINKKDMFGVEMFFCGKNVDEKFVSKFRLLPSLFGDGDIIERARKNVSNKKSLRALDSLQNIMAALTLAGLDKYVTVDLGLLRGEYYTGLVIKGFTENLGLVILDGGRYDYLAASFGTPLPAVGFSVGIKRLLMALENEGKLVKLPQTDCAYISDGKNYAFEYEYVSKLRSKGVKAEKLFGLTQGELIDYCKSKGIPLAVVISGSRAMQTEVK